MIALHSEEVSSLIERYATLYQLRLWEGFGSGNCVRLLFTEGIEKILMALIDEARRLKQERLRDRDLRSVVKSLTKRGIEITDELVGYDQNDIVGLIGEMIAEGFSNHLGNDSIFPKWRYSGSSKSRGIDLVARQRSDRKWQLVLYEAKYLHEEVKGMEPDLCCHRIKNRFAVGIDEFEEEKTKFDLASIVIRLGDFVRLGEAVGSDVSSTREYLELISEGLRRNEYFINVATLVDEKYCNDDTLHKSVIDIEKPFHVGDHHPTLILIRSPNMEEVTDRLCSTYVGSF